MIADASSYTVSMEAAVTVTESIGVTICNESDASAWTWNANAQRAKNVQNMKRIDLNFYVMIS